MENLKKPSMLVAILLTAAAVCSLLSFILQIAKNRDVGVLVLFQGFTFVLLLISAIGNWVIYFQNYVKYIVKNNSKENLQ